MTQKPLNTYRVWFRHSPLRGISRNDTTVIAASEYDAERKALNSFPSGGSVERVQMEIEGSHTSSGSLFARV
jgi:hypothetical protein